MPILFFTVSLLQHCSRKERQPARTTTKESRRKSGLFSFFLKKTLTAQHLQHCDVMQGWKRRRRARRFARMKYQDDSSLSWWGWTITERFESRSETLRSGTGLRFFLQRKSEEIDGWIVKYEGKSCRWTSWNLVLDPLFSMEYNMLARYLEPTCTLLTSSTLTEGSFVSCTEKRITRLEKCERLVHTGCKTNCGPVVGLSEGWMSGLRCRRSSPWRQGQRGASDAKLEFKSGHRGFADVFFGLCSRTGC